MMLRRRKAGARRRGRARHRQGRVAARRTSSSGSSPGDIAVIDHADIDRVAADGLIDAGVVAVVNASPCDHRPLPERRAAAAGAGRDRADRRRRQGDHGRRPRRGARSTCATACWSSAARRSAPATSSARRRSSGGWTTPARASAHELQRFAENTLEYVRREADLVFAPIVHADAAHDVRGPARPRGRPRPRLQAGPPDPAALHPRVPARCSSGSTAAPTPSSRWASPRTSSSATSTRCPPQAMEVGAEHVHHVHPDGRNPGYEELAGVRQALRGVRRGGHQRGRRDAPGLRGSAPSSSSPSAPTDTMVEFLDKGRPGMSSTFLTRLRLGPMLVDAKGVARLYEGNVRRRRLRPAGARPRSSWCSWSSSCPNPCT